MLQCAKDVINNALKSDKPIKIKLLGDSITHGVGGTGFDQDGYSFTSGFARNTKGYCWAKRFKEHMEEKYNCIVTNNACTGTNIRFVIERFDELVQGGDLVICTIGTNDRHRYEEEGPKPTREEWGNRFYSSLTELYKMFKTKNIKVIFMANIPASAENELDGDCGGQRYWRVLHMDDINALYKKGAEEFGYPMISMYDLFTDYCDKNAIEIDSLLDDGLHPNDKGYDVMFELLIKELKV